MNMHRAAYPAESLEDWLYNRSAMRDDCMRQATQERAMFAAMAEPARIPDPFSSPCPDCRGRGKRRSGLVSEAGATINTDCEYCGGIGSKEGATL